MLSAATQLPACGTILHFTRTRAVLQEELASCITTELGKVTADAHGDVFRGLGAMGCQNSF